MPTREMPPALVLGSRLSTDGSVWSTFRVVSAMNRSGSGTSSSINHKSPSNLRSFLAEFRDLPPSAPYAGPTDLPDIVAVRRPASARDKTTCRPARHDQQDQRPRSGRPWQDRRRSRRRPRRGAQARASTCAGEAPGISGAIAGEAGQRDVRAHEGAGAARAFLALGIDHPRFGDEHPAPAADPAPFGDHLAGLDRPGEMQVERGGQQETVADQPLAA